MGVDKNSVQTLLGETTAGAATPVKVSASGELVVEYVSTGTGGSGAVVSKNDLNHVPTIQAEESDVAYSTLVDSNGYLITTGITIS